MTHVHLLRRLGFKESFAIVAGSMIGTGVFLKTAVMAQEAGSPLYVLLAWLLAGMLSFMGALAYAELGCLFPAAGGEYVFLRKAYGPFTGFLFGWTRFWIASPGSIAAYAIGSVTFLDFGMVKRWSPGEWETLEPCMDAIIVDRDPERLLTTMEQSGFLRPGHGLSAEAVYEYVSAPYRPYLSDVFTFDRAFMRDTIQRLIDVNGPHAAVIERINMPASFLMLDRVVWGITALLGKLELTAPWRAMLLEYRCDAPPATPLGELERSWRLGQRS